MNTGRGSACTEFAKPTAQVPTKAPAKSTMLIPERKILISNTAIEAIESPAAIALFDDFEATSRSAALASAALGYACSLCRFGASGFKPLSCVRSCGQSTETLTGYVSNEAELPLAVVAECGEAAAPDGTAIGYFLIYRVWP